MNENISSTICQPVVPKRITKAEWLLIQAVRSYQFGSVTVFIKDGKAWRLEKSESQMLDCNPVSMEVEIG